MSFERNIGRYIVDAEVKLADMRQRWDRGSHRCDCVYCDVELEEGLDDDMLDELQDDIIAAEKEVKTLKDYKKRLEDAGCLS